MLLRYVVLFLNMVAASSMLTPGWGPKGRPKRGGLYWIPPIKLRGKERPMEQWKKEDLPMEQRQDADKELALSRRICCVVLQAKEEEKDNDYSVRVARIIYKPKGKYGLPATRFFEGVGKIETFRKGATFSDSYRILPHPTYQLSGGPDEIALYNEQLMIMPPEALGRLMVASGMVNGWGAGQVGPLLGAVYWVYPGLSAQSGIYVPCVVIRRVGNMYRLAVMYKHEREGLDKYRVTEFFGNEDLRTGIPKVGYNDLKGHYIYPHKKLEVKGNRYAMQRWGGRDLLKMPKEGLDRLVAVSGMLYGRDAQRGGVYWIQPHLLGMEAKVGLYIPCVLIIHWVGELWFAGQRHVTNEYRVVAMFTFQGPNGRHATEFFGDAKLHTPAGITDFQNYYFHPDHGYQISGGFEIMQRWEDDVVTIMPEDGVKKLDKLVSPEPEHGNQDMEGNRHGK